MSFRNSKLTGQMFDHKEVPFILTVAVYPCPESEVDQRQEGQCVLDTGCLQGNIISANFARRLGYRSYEPLKAREENGGTVATGQVHTVLGAVHISWYHTTSPKVFRDMRFLVSESNQFDLVVGTHSIVRHGLISPPNLGVITTVSSSKEETLIICASIAQLIHSHRPQKRRTSSERIGAKDRV